eukprot:CAMPEP_0174756084 /NCGR_PEP_ID=MMETSP1094-20130205/106579_1 /TAXON_ID=156173 /ORGANISM="Chrysochromulina brevifilum, Strain UTEX LB 985" /LENGTH=164 /DNA_ID=CAMNT_0015961989 /DNA_START=255 /DNA_END=749 /DNA_ORIENTATION=+
MAALRLVVVVIIIKVHQVSEAATCHELVPQRLVTFECLLRPQTAHVPAPSCDLILELATTPTCMACEDGCVVLAALNPRGLPCQAGHQLEQPTARERGRCRRASALDNHMDKGRSVAGSALRFPGHQQGGKADIHAAAQAVEHRELHDTQPPPAHGAAALPADP